MGLSVGNDKALNFWVHRESFPCDESFESKPILNRKCLNHKLEKFHPKLRSSFRKSKIWFLSCLPHHPQHASRTLFRLTRKKRRENVNISFFGNGAGEQNRKEWERATKHTYFAAACISFHSAPLICLRCVPTSPSTTIELPISARRETSFSWRASCVKGVGCGVGRKIQGSCEAKPNNRSVSCDIIYACERLIRFRAKVRRCLLHTRGLSIIKGRWLELTNDEAWHVKLRFVGLCRRTQISRHIAHDCGLWSHENTFARWKNRDDILTYQFLPLRDTESSFASSFGDYVTIVCILLTTTEGEESKISVLHVSKPSESICFSLYIRSTEEKFFTNFTKNPQVFFFSK